MAPNSSWLNYKMQMSLRFLQAKFECIFREFEPLAAFHYLRSFRRIRVDFESHLSASKAKISMDNTPFGETVINCYFVQVSPVQ